MNQEYKQLASQYSKLLPQLKAISDKIEDTLCDILKKTIHIDMIVSRAKDPTSFIKKAEKKKPDGTPKYSVPLKEIQDKIGARIVVYYKSDINSVAELVKKHFRHIEEQLVVDDDPSKFGYEGFHMIYKIPNFLTPEMDDPDLGDFFELQIKTLYQHAWAQSNHGLGYKNDSNLKDDEA